MGADLGDLGVQRRPRTRPRRDTPPAELPAAIRIVAAGDALLARSQTAKSSMSKNQRYLLANEAGQAATIATVKQLTGKTRLPAGGIGWIWCSGPGTSRGS